MSSERVWTGIEFAALAALAIGIIGCAVGSAGNAPAFYRGWLCAYIFWLGVPLGAVTLILVHDLTGGAWMASARPTLAAAATTMPVATLAGIPVLLGLRAVYPWPGAARTVWERVSDAALVHELTGCCPSVAIHVPWDRVDDPGPARAISATPGT